MKSIVALSLAAVLLAGVARAQAPLQVQPVDALPKDAATLPIHVGGRVLHQQAALWRQWPGTYFETAFRGTEALFRVGTGDVILKVSVDGGAPVALVKPAPGVYRVGGLAAGDHQLRIDIASESQAAPTGFEGFYAPDGTTGRALTPRAHQIEFIGDSHTVGYGNTSPTRKCTDAEIWSTTDTSQGLPPRLARRFDADYAVNAISGRGIVRNYNGFAADTLPQAYPFTLFDHATPHTDADWHPQVIVIALGTNDFTTPLNPGEKWKTRDALHADYEATYASFIGGLRARNPQAYFLLWATDMADGEIEAEVAKVAEHLKAAGERRVAYLPMNGLAFSACNAHPDLKDDEQIATALGDYIQAHPEVWAGR